MIVSTIRTSAMQLYPRPPCSMGLPGLPSASRFETVPEPMMLPAPRVLVLARWAISVPKSKVMRSEEHTSELQSLMRISYAVFCLKKKKNINTTTHFHYSLYKHNTIKLNQNSHSPKTMQVTKQSKR